MVNYKSLGLEFENECLRGCRDSFEYVAKIPDTRSLSGLVNKVINFIRNNHVVAKLYRERYGYLIKENNFISVKSPYDLICCHKGRTIAIECKQTKLKSLAFANIKPHQIEELFKISQAGGIGVFCVSFNNRERKKALKVNKTVIIDINMFMFLKNKYDSQSRKSIPMEDFLHYGIILDRIKKGGKFQIDFDKLLPK